MTEEAWTVDDIVLHAYMLIVTFTEGDATSRDMSPLLMERLLNFVADGFERPIPRRLLTSALARLCEHGFLYPIGPCIVRLTEKGAQRLHERLIASDADSAQPPAFKPDIEERLALPEVSNDEAHDHMLATLVACWHFERANGYPASRDTLLAVNDAATGKPIEPVFTGAALDALCKLGLLEPCVTRGTLSLALTATGRRVAQDAFGAAEPDLRAWRAGQAEGFERCNTRLAELRRQWRADR